MCRLRVTSADPARPPRTDLNEHIPIYGITESDKTNINVWKAVSESERKWQSDFLDNLY